MDALKIFLVFGIILSVSCGSSFNSFPRRGKSPEARAESKTILSGFFTSSSGELIDLSSDNGLPTVLQFASDTCGVCREEASEFREHLKGLNTSKINLYSVLIGAFPEDAVAWKNELQLPWTVGIDTNSSLFKSYCKQDLVPCLIIHIPNKGVVLNRHGKVPLSEILSVTGEW